MVVGSAIRPSAQFTNEGSLFVSGSNGGDDWGHGYNLGLLFAPGANSRFGISYRSKISHELSICKAEPPVGGTLIGTCNNDVNIPSVQ